MVASTEQIMPQVAPRTHPQRAFALALAAILVLGAGLRLWLLARDVPTLDSDEAMIGLMALHVPRGDLSVFLWGQSYMGSLEALLSAPILWAFGPSTLTLRLVPLLLGLGSIATLALLGAWLISRRVGLLAAALLALGAPFFTILSIRAFGGYSETLLFGNLILWGTLRGDRAPARVALLGMLIGIALWTDLLVGPFLVAAGAIWWWQRRRDLLRHNGAILAGGAIVGALPAIGDNLLHGFATISTIGGLSVAGGPGGSGSGPPGFLLGLLHNAWLELTVSLPILAGGAVGGTQSAGYTSADYLAAAAAAPWVYALGLALGLGALALTVSLAIPFMRQLWALRLPLLAGNLQHQRQRREGHERGAKNANDPDLLRQESRQNLRRQYEGALLIIAACYVLAFMLQRQGLFAVPRYLFPLFALVPALVGQIERLAEKSGRCNSAQTSMYARGVTGFMLAICLPVMVWNVFGCLRTTPLLTAARDHGVWISGRDGALLSALRAHHVRTVISNDYWEGLRLTFESDERIITVMRFPDGHLGFNRYAPYVTQGLRDPRPAYVELRGTDEAAALQTCFAAGELPGYTLSMVGAFVVAMATSG